MRLGKYRDRDDEIINNINTLRHNAQACISCIEFTEQFYLERENYTAIIQYILCTRSVLTSDNFLPTSDILMHKEGADMY